MAPRRLADLEAVHRERPRFTAKITGGTAKYAGARGTVTVVGGPVTRYTIRLVG